MLYMKLLLFIMILEFKSIKNQFFKIFEYKITADAKADNEEEMRDISFELVVLVPTRCSIFLMI